MESSILLYSYNGIRCISTYRFDALLYIQNECKKKGIKKPKLDQLKVDTICQTEILPFKKQPLEDITFNFGMP